MLLLCILNQKVCSNEWCVMKAVESVAKWKSFCCQLAQSKHQNWADVVCITAEKFIFKFCFYDGRILFDMPLKPQSSHLSFLRTNQSCFCGDCWVCLLIRGLCRATNQHVMCAQYQYPINISFLTAKNKTKQLLGVWKIVENIMTSCKRCLLFSLSLHHFEVRMKNNKNIVSDSLRHFTNRIEHTHYQECCT